jgi:predicted lipid-binding transport protein (Tim44 family)
MTSKKFVLLIAALLTGSSLPALAQSRGGSGAGGAAGASAANGASGANPGAAATQPSNAAFQNPIGQGAAPATSANNNQNAGQTVGSIPAAGAVGHAANGKPIGNSGSGPGSPEQPIDSGSR